MEKLYDILYAGALVEGQDAAQVRTQLGLLFKANEETLAKLFSGKPQMIKRAVDKTTAAKYRNAMHKAGAVALIRLAETPTAVATAAQPQAPGASAGKQSMADRLAAVAGDPPAEPPPAREPVATSQRAPLPEQQTDSTISLSPPGTAMLREDERHAFEELDIDTSAIVLDDKLVSPTPLPERIEGQPVDTSHMSMGDVGDDIPHLDTTTAAVDPDISGINLTPEGTDFSDCAEEVEPVDVADISQVSLAEEGSDMLEEQYRKKDTAKAPNTDHISLSPE